MILIMAWRNIWRSMTRSLVVMGAIAVGIWAALSLTGFATGMVKSYVNNAVQNIVSHIQVHQPEFLDENEVKYNIPDAEAVEQAIRAEPGVKAVSVRSVVNGMISSSKGARGVSIKGVIPEEEARVNALDENIVEGDYLSGEGRNPILVSSELAKKLNVKVRSKVVLNFQDRGGSITAAAFRIVGIFDTDNNPFDLSHVFVRRNDLNSLLIPAADSSLAVEGLAHEIALMVDDIRQVNLIAASLSSKFPNLKVQTYREISPDLELYEGQIKNISLIYLTVIMLALVFGIINTMLMAVLERIKELGMLMAIGMNKLRVFLMIVLESALLGLVAMPVGLLLGYITIEYVGANGIDMSMYAKGLESFGMSSIIYFELDPIVYLQVAVGVFLTAILASIYPALKAIRLKPVEALRTI
ncbi:MAG: ABC transporter permease [Lewinellaceae bacterium]|nr:ABC transporter permease [Phaeodactylibacter sp.]MCB9347063.1 ABC transporter permease [Lewinellaceae bacterium]